MLKMWRDKVMGEEERLARVMMSCSPLGGSFVMVSEQRPMLCFFIPLFDTFLVYPEPEIVKQEKN